MRVDTVVLAHDMRYFAIAYAIAIGAAFLPLEPVWLKWIVAVDPHRHLRLVRQGPLRGRPGRRRGRPRAAALPPPRPRRAPRDDPAVPRLRVVNLQVLAALALIVLGAVFFVDAVDHLARQLNVDSVLLALVIAPIATELPEKFNSVIWVRQGKDTLAMGNITGAMVFQSTIPTVVALRLRVGHLGRRPRASYIAFASAGIAFLSSARHLHPDGPPGRPARPVAARRRGLLRGLPARSSSGSWWAPSADRRRPADILGRPKSREPDRMLTEKSDATPAADRPPCPQAGRARRADLLLRG